MITAMPVNGNGHAKPSFPETLSKREDEVVQLVANGLSNKEIADKLFISVRTVKAHLTSIFSKTGFRDRLELAVKMRHH
jgi:DNA-binding NarL/FixJ family response regulator